MLQGITVASPPSALIALATSSQASALRLETTTLAPRPAIVSAIDRPIPRLEPVISATLPAISNGDFILLSTLRCIQQHPFGLSTLTGPSAARRKVEPRRLRRYSFMQ